VAAAGYGDLLDALRGVTWPARRAARGRAAGTHVSRLRGSSAEFTEYRAYRQGDDPRRLDWKLLARTDRAYLRITREPSTHPTLLVLDASASMAFPAETSAKWVQARRLAVALASIANATGDGVGWLIAGHPRAARPLRARRGVVSELARLVDAITPTGDAPLAPILRGAPQASRLVLITDMLGDEEALHRAAREQRARGVDVIVAHIVAREELSPPPGPFIAEDPERRDVSGTLARSTADAYRTNFATWRDTTARAWRASGARLIEIPADEPTDRAVRRLVSSAGDESDT
jgi:uncharacterized protein (DUF58 family)